MQWRLWELVAQAQKRSEVGLTSAAAEAWRDVYKELSDAGCPARTAWKALSGRK